MNWIQLAEKLRKSNILFLRQPVPQILERKTAPVMETPNTNFIFSTEKILKETQDTMQQSAGSETKTDKEDKYGKVKIIIGINTSHLCSGHPIYCISK
jgi:hypothetical protein